jgi:prepilin-type N-terminal cleavage/methylation domain-containing protein
MRIRFAQNGFSLIEVVISMAILGILVTAILSATVGSESNVFRNSVLGSASCRTEAQSILNNFKSKGLIRRYNMQLTTALTPAVPTAADQRPATTDIAANELGLNFTERWTPAPYEITIETATPIIRPYRLLMGSITTIETIYNNRNSEVCTTGTNLGLPSTAAGTPLNLLLRHPVGVEDVLPGQTSSGLRNPTAHLRIQAHEANGSGAQIPCTPNLYTRPPSGAGRKLVEFVDPNPLVGDSDLPLAMNSAMTNTNNYPADPNLLRAGIGDTTSRDDIAWEMTISITHEDKNGQIQTCSASERFQYTAMRFDHDKFLHVRGENSDLPSPPATSYQPLNASVVSTNNPLGYTYLNPPPAPPTSPGRAPYRNCSVTPEATIDIFVRNARPNTIFMCRNLSFQRALQFGSTVGAPLKVLANAFPNGGIPGNGGLRQSFMSDEIIKQNYFTTDSGDGVIGDMFVLGLPYPNGTYYCHSGDGCTAIPSFLTNASTGTFNANGGNWDGYFVPTNNNSDQDTVGFWTPCERAFLQCAQNASSSTIISHAPSVATFENGDGTTFDRYHLRYDNLPPGCEVHLQIAEVDAAYNVRATEVREFVQEPLPGNKLCWTGSGVPGRNPNQWYFSCDPTPAATNQIAATNYPACAMVTPPNTTVPPFTRATYNTFPGSPPCCIDFPGDPDLPANDSRRGIWRNGNPPTVRDP